MDSFFFTDREPLKVSRAFNGEEKVAFRIARIDAPEADTRVLNGIDKGDKVYTKESCFECDSDAKQFLCCQLQCLIPYIFNSLGLVTSIIDI